MPQNPLTHRAQSVATSALDSRAVAELRRAVARLDVSARAGRFTREVSLTLAVVLLVGLGAASADPQQPATAPVAATTADAPVAREVPRGPTTTQRLAARTPDLSLPAPKAAPAPKPAAVAVRPPAPAKRWLPTGTGMWLHDWKRSEHGSAPHVVAKSRRSGFSHLYVQTGSTRKGWIGDEVLSELLPATKGTDIKVIAWDFPKLIDPEADARRMARAATWSRPGVPQVAAVAPDVETAAEGTNLSTPNVHRYYTELRKHLPAHVAILATVPWPSEKRTGWYPYDDTAPYADAFIPMAYWYNRDAAVVTATSMTWLGRFGKPVMPVGQGYQGNIDVARLPADPHLHDSVTAFADTARKHGAQSISLWSWQTTEPEPWKAFAKAAGTIGPKIVKAEPVPAVKAPKPSNEKAKEKANQMAPGRKHDRRPKDVKTG